MVSEEIVTRITCTPAMNAENDVQPESDLLAIREPINNGAPILDTVSDDEVLKKFFSKRIFTNIINRCMIK